MKTRVIKVKDPCEKPVFIPQYFDEDENSWVDITKEIPSFGYDRYEVQAKDTKEAAIKAIEDFIKENANSTVVFEKEYTNITIH